MNMRTSLELPDSLFLELKLAAVNRGVTLKVLIREAVENELHGRSAPVRGYRVQPPLVPRKGRAKIDLTNAQIEDLLA